MKTLLLQRQSPNGKAVRGKLHLGSVPPKCAPSGIARGTDPLCSFSPLYTLENLDYIIPDGTYTLIVTPSPRFKKDLPLVVGVSGRTGIRFHRGSMPEHSKGCILLDSDKSVSILTSFVKSNEKVLLKISSES